MYVFKKIKVRSYEKGLLFRDREFKGILNAGRHWFFDPFNKIRVDVVSMRAPWLVHEDLDVIIRSGVLQDDALVLDLKDYQRALVWIDERFDRVLGRGRYAIWTPLRDIRYEIVDARQVRFDHPDIAGNLTGDGYDFVLNDEAYDVCTGGSVGQAGDGDGPDPDPTGGGARPTPP